MDTFKYNEDLTYTKGQNTLFYRVSVTKKVISMKCMDKTNAVPGGAFNAK